MPLVLASLGLGSAVIGQWIPTHKGILLLVAILLMSLSLYGGIREKIKTGRNTGLVISIASLVITAVLIAYGFRN